MDIEWNVGGDTLVAAKIAGMHGNQLWVNGREVPVRLSLRKPDAFSFALDDGRSATLSATPQYGTYPLIELRVEHQLITPRGAQPLLCTCGNVLSPNDRYCDACARKPAPPRRTRLVRQVRSAIRTMKVLAVIFAVYGLIMFAREQGLHDAILRDIEWMNPDDIYPDAVNGVVYTVADLRAHFAWTEWSTLIGHLMIAAIMMGLALWARRAPLAALLVGAATYAALAVGYGIVQPDAAAQGIMLKTIVLVFLWGGIKPAFTLRAEHD